MTRLLSLLLTIVLALPLVAHGADQEPSLQVNVEGLSGALADHVAAQLSMLRASDGELPAPSRIRWLHARAADEIRLALQPFGHYRPVVDADLRRDGPHWIATYRVEPGERVPIGIVDLRISGEAAEDSAFAALQQGFPLVAGEPLDHARYEAAKRGLLTLAAERGYFDAALTRSEVRVSLETYRAEVTLHFDSGPRFRFGPFRFDAVALDERLLRRYLRIAEGEPFSARRLLELQQALIDSDHFAAVLVEPHREQTEGLAVPIHVHLELRKAGRYLAGIGYGSDTGVRGRLGLERRRVNALGHHFDAELVASSLGGKIATQYQIPGRVPQNDTLLLHAAATREVGDIQDRDTLTLGASLQHVLGRWQRTWDLELQRERFRLGDVEATSVLLMPGVQLSHSQSDDRFATRRGRSLSLRLRGAHRALLSEISFVQAHAAGKWIQPLGETSRVIARGALGATWTDAFTELPASLRFFAGGDRSVRGYELDVIGPLDSEGNVIGGRYLAVASLELDRHIADKWSAALFVDTGDAFDGERPTWRTGAGIGLRWQSPIGPVRIDLATGLDAPGDKLRLHLTIGPDF